MSDPSLIALTSFLNRFSDCYRGLIADLAVRCIRPMLSNRQGFSQRRSGLMHHQHTSLPPFITVRVSQEGLESSYCCLSNKRFCYQKPNYHLVRTTEVIGSPFRSTPHGLSACSPRLLGLYNIKFQMRRDPKAEAVTCESNMAQALRPLNRLVRTFRVEKKSPLH